MRKSKREAWMEKSNRIDRRTKVTEMLESQREVFDKKTKADMHQPKKTFRWVNTTAVRWPRSVHVPRGYILEFIVLLDYPLPRNKVESKLDQVFGYLKKQEVKK